MSLQLSTFTEKFPKNVFTFFSVTCTGSTLFLHFFHTYIDLQIYEVFSAEFYSSQLL